MNDKLGTLADLFLFGIDSTKDLQVFTADMDLDLNTPEGMIHLATESGFAYNPAAQLLDYAKAMKFLERDVPRLEDLEVLATKLIQNLTTIWVNEFDRLHLFRNPAPGQPDIRIEMSKRNWERKLEYYRVESAILFIARGGDRQICSIGLDDLSWQFILAVMEGTKAIVSANSPAAGYTNFDLSLGIHPPGKE